MELINTPHPHSASSPEQYQRHHKSQLSHDATIYPIKVTEVLNSLEPILKPSGSSCIGNPIVVLESGKRSTINSSRASFYWPALTSYIDRSYVCETAFRCAERCRMEPNHSKLYLNSYSNFTILNGHNHRFGCPALASHVSVDEPMESRDVGHLHIMFGLGQRRTVSRLEAQDIPKGKGSRGSPLTNRCVKQHGGP